METPKDPTSIDNRISEGLTRIAIAMRSDEWSKAEKAGLKPTQLAILEFLAGRDSARVKEIAAHLGVSQPTATDSIAALERKGLVAKASAPGDKRATAIHITAEGKAAFGSVSPIETAAMEAARSLSPGEQEGLLLSLVKMIRHLQEADAIPIQRMCTSCRYFRPYQHSGAAKPHHCNFVNAAFGRNELRIDCRDHETADPATRAATWDAFEKG
ncbi:MarR family transcriptional regulator [Rhizobium viscosum]|uniref:DNA-binding MarR family transcriptional regulator n=1 Tax=Rhizobium viscosum TaxID=1673 RepID=A0ABR9IKF3_RHIVS|nr:MarR family winged helix-turn-helix transcriptional regulator [Rhizobium viscosum]MBE1503660.1 DNA-binding MarR family transcriptional regulator [Rhizobium viscosum]